MPNQFSTQPDESPYMIQVDKAKYKLFRRLNSLDFSCVVEIYLDDKGRVKSLRINRAPEEILDKE